MTINVTYKDGTATGAVNPANVDYDNDEVPQLVFGANETTKDISIPITDDGKVELDETFMVTIGGTLPAGFELGNATITVTITDDDNAPVLADIEDETVRAYTLVDITAEATDADNDEISYVWTRKSTETTPALPDTPLDDAQLTFTPTEEGTYTMTVTASDGNGNEDTEEVVITVTAPATVSVPETLSVAEDAGNAKVTVTASEGLGSGGDIQHHIR